MVDSPTPRARMARDIGAGSASSGSPLAPPKASPCVLDRLDLARPRAHVAAESTISAAQRALDALAVARGNAAREPNPQRRRRLRGRVLLRLLRLRRLPARPRGDDGRLRDRLCLLVEVAVRASRLVEASARLVAVPAGLRERLEQVPDLLGHVAEACRHVELVPADAVAVEGRVHEVVDLREAGPQVAICQ